MPERDFLAEVHQENDFTPFADFDNSARFAVRLDCPAATFDVTVRIKFDFGLAFLGTMGMTASRFKSKYVRQITRYWDRRYRISFQSERGGTRYFTPTVSVQEVNNAANAHFIVDIRRLHAARSVVLYSGLHTNRTGRCILYSDAVKARPKGPVTNLGWRMVFGATRERLVQKQTLDDFSGLNLAVTFNQNSTQISNPGTVDALANRYMSHRETRPLVVLLVVGYRMANEGVQWSSRRAAEVKRRLKERGVQDHLVVTHDGGVGPTAKARITLEPASVQNILNLPNDFPIAAHEFGHKLGLVDEYPRPGVDVEEDWTYREMRRTAQRHGVPLPAFNSFSTSLMSVGDQVLPFHYIPFAETIRVLQFNWGARNDAWAQVPGNTRINGPRPNSPIGIDPNPVTAVTPDDESLGLENLFA